MSYLLYLVGYIVLQILTYIVTPLLACFWEIRDGWCDNGSYWGPGPRLPKWLSWFDTPDNSLAGDTNWAATHSYLKWSDRCAWLYRNSLYGFKWTVLSKKIQIDRKVVGSTDINYHTKKYGYFFIYQCNGAWQYKCVTKLPFGKIFIGNFGWLLDDTNKTNALFMFSPRIK